jgi:D-amino-acid oxidase
VERHPSQCKLTRVSSGKSDLYQFRVLPNDHPFPAGFTSGLQFETVVVNPELYLPSLKSELESRGVKFLRRRVKSLDEACGLAGESGAVINATGLGELHNNFERRLTHERLT